MPDPATAEGRASESPYRRLRIWILGFTIAFVGLSAGLQAYFLLEQRENALASGEAHARSDALAAVAQLRGTMMAYDATLAQIAAHSPRLGGPGGAPGAWWAFLETAFLGTEDVAALSVIDASGTVVHSTDRSLIGTSFAGRYLFRTLRDDRAVTVAVDTPKVDPNGAVALAIGRRLAHNFDEFSGAAVATFSPDVLRRIAQHFHLGSGSLRILHPSGVILLHEPSDRPLIGTPAGNDPALAAFRTGRSEGAARIGIGTGGGRVDAFRVLSEPSLVAAVSLVESEILADWRRDLVFDSIIVTVFAAILLAAAFFIVLRLRAQGAVEQALARQDHELRLAQSVAGVGSLTLDARAGTIRFSPEFARIVGWPPGSGEAPLERVRALAVPAERERLDDAIRRCAQPGGMLELDLRAVRGDGAERIFRLRGLGERDGGAVVAIQDVTDVLESETRMREAQKIEAMGQLTGGVAHDFNNLLTVILGNAEQLVDDLKNQPALRSMAEMTLMAAERGAELTRRLLAFARRQTLAPKETDVNALIDGMDGLMRRTLGEQIEIKLAPGTELWRTQVDANQLETALLNLAINARDAMAEGGTLKIRTANIHLDHHYAAGRDDVRPGDYVMISVADTGCGMSAEVRTRAFEPFFTTKDVGKGSGLGLSMVFGFVKQSGGHVSIYSEPGHGTEVRLYLPRSDATAAAAAAAHAAGPPVGGVETILMVEDEPLVRDSTQTMLQSLGYRVLVAENGPRALAALGSAGPVDLLLTDMMMPGGMTGRALAAEAAKLRPGIKVLFMSGYSEETINGQLGKDGIHFLQKPFRRDELAAKVRQALAAASQTPARSD